MNRVSINKILLSLGRLEGKMDSLLTAQSAWEEKMSTLERRITSLEKIQAYWAGAVTLCSFLIGLLLHYFRP